MKLQLTALAAAIAFTVSTAALANQGPNYEHDGVNKPGGENAFTQQENQRQLMNGFTSLNISGGTAGQRETDHDQNNQTSSTATSSQAGTEQFSRILQTGSNNGSWVGNEAHVDQGGGASEKNVSSVEQRNGSYNRAYVTQKGTGLNESLVVQSVGNNNTATVDQYGEQDQSNILQRNGDHNTATVNQRGDRNQSYIEQHNGDHNNATVEQRNSQLSDSYIRQIGSHNKAEVSQLNNSDLSDSIIRQTGEWNEAYVSQELNSRETWSFIEQDGTRNVADVTQKDADLSASYIYQRGHDHSATVKQTNEDASLSMIRQNGAGAIASHTQTNGSGNFSSSYQW